MKKPETFEEFKKQITTVAFYAFETDDESTMRELWDALKPQGMKREEAEELFSQLMFASDGMRTAGSMKMSERKTGTRKAKEDCHAAH